MLTPLDSRVSDVNAEALGISLRDLMGNAGRSVAEELGRRYPDKRILFVCGSGNNGGDGFAAAMTMDPSNVRIALLCEPSRIRSDESRFYYSLLECDIQPYDTDLISDADIIVDCALGTGTSGIARGPYASFIRDANASGKPILSVDIPSGLGTDLCIEPTCTITFMDLKEGMDANNSGEIVVTDIGIPIEAYREVGPGDMLRYPIPSKDSHKGQNGRLMIIAGGPYYGAPAMASYSALRVGTDMVRLYSPESIHSDVSHISPVLMITDLSGDRLLPEHVESLLRESTSFDAVLIGPGLGVSEDTREAIRTFVQSCRKPMVIDADAITAISGMRFSIPVIMTPHRAEFDRLGNGSIEDVSRLVGATILLKGNVDTISDGHITRLNRTGTPGMTGAGTGDVLAGCVAGLLSKGMTAFDAACLGAYICGKAGEMAFDARSYGMIATDVAENIPYILKDGL